MNLNSLTSLNKPTIKISVVSDVVCPWCYIGKRRLEKAVNNLSQKFNFEIEYFPFELNPQIPAEGLNQKEYLSNKFGGPERYAQITGNVTGVAAHEGLSFNFADQRVSPNTRKAHRIIQIAKESGVQLAMVEAFFKAYFTDGVDLSQDENLIAIAVQYGLSRERVEALLQSSEGVAEVEMAERELQQAGISGVPFYIIDNKYGISGAQPSESFIKAFEEIGSTKVVASGESCDVDGNNC